MSSHSRRSRPFESGFRVGILCVMVLALAAAWPPTAPAGAAPSPVVGQTDPERDPGLVDEGEPEPAGSLPLAEQPPPETQPRTIESEATLQEPEPVSLPPGPAPEPTPESWGPSRILLDEPAFALSVLAGSDATFVLEVAHAGGGGPDAKEIRFVAPAGWSVGIVPAANGELLYDNDGDGWPETTPLFAGDRTYVAVIVTTPAGLIETSTATIQVSASSFGADIDAFRSSVALSVSAVVPGLTPTAAPISTAGVPAPERSPIDVSSPSTASPELLPVDFTPDPSDSPEPLASDASPATSTSTSTSTSDQPSSDEPASSLPPDDEQPEELSGPSASGSASTSALRNASSSAPASASASPPAGEPASQPVVTSIADDGPISLVPGGTVEIRHGFAVDGLSENQTVTLRIEAAMDPAWSTLEAGKAIDGPAGDLLLEVTGNERAGVIVRIHVPVDAVAGTVATLDVSATLVPVDPVVAGVTADAVEVASTTDTVDPAGAASDASDAISQVDNDGAHVGSSYALVVEAVESQAALSVQGGVDFGDVRVDGRIDPSTTGVTASADETGATYVRNGAITLTVAGVDGSWSISCQAVELGVTDGTARFAWREPGGTWQTFPASDGECIRGEGPAVVSIDVQYRVEWGDPIGTVEAQITFTLSGGGLAVSRRSGE